MIQRKDPTKTNTWEKLTKNYQKIRDIHMLSMFQDDNSRAERFSVSHKDILIDFSKNRINAETFDLLIRLAEECGLKEGIEAMFTGEKINETENRSVLHTALRNRSGSPVLSDGTDVMPEVNNVLQRMEDFSKRVIQGQWRGYTGKPIEHIINIGIGGSDLGPVMVTAALKPFKIDHITSHFVSNVDGSDILGVFEKIDPETSLFLISSKTFTTQETMTNAKTAREWFLSHAKDPGHIKQHFAAISTNRNAVTDFGIDPVNMFEFWDWVGGRYSLWSAIGLSIILSIGYDNFIELLEGGHEMDNHFRNTPFNKNAPVILGMLDVWYSDFFGCSTKAILPYDQYMHRFPAYLQQAFMESNGKFMSRNGNKVNYSTCPVIWGEPGTNGQHSFYQLIHQGTQIIPCDFLAAANSNNPVADHQEKLLSNFFAQTEALMKGKKLEEAHEELIQSGKSKEEADKIAPYRVFEGNRPTNSILFNRLTPRTLGNLIALYEHAIFTEGWIWNIYSFDQWGVELGKQLAGKILPELITEGKTSKHDPSTNNLINYYKMQKNKN